MTINSIIIITIMLCSCALPPPDNPVVSAENLSVQSPFQDKYRLFLDKESTLTKAPVVRPSVTSLTIQFSDSLPPSVLGMCTWYTGGKRTVDISRSFWMKAIDSDREEVIFHELGHCLLNREHVPDIIKWHPASIMYPYIIDHTVYESTSYVYNAYQYELFNYTGPNIIKE